VKVLPNTINEQVPQRLWRVLDFFLGSIGPYEIVYFLKVFLFAEEVGNLSSVKDIVDVF